MKEWIQLLIDKKIGTILADEPLYKYTTWRIGGPADAVIQPSNKNNLLKALAILKKYNVPWKVIGKGSNILVLDSGFRGAIILLSQPIFNEISVDKTTLYAGAYASIIRLANIAARNGLTGLEFAGGIPGTVGGAVYMNAGAHGSDVSAILKQADVLIDDQVVTWEEKDFHFSYRTSELQFNQGILLSAVFQLEHGDRREIAEKMARYKSRRRESQPYDMPCSGSVFRNPNGDYAGRLIEELGLKGYSVGGAQVSTKHANFIVNRGNATADDVFKLIHFIKEKVFEQYHIKLESEVEVVGKE